MAIDRSKKGGRSAKGAAESKAPKAHKTRKPIKKIVQHVHATGPDDKGAKRPAGEAAAAGGQVEPAAPSESGADEKLVREVCKLLKMELTDPLTTGEVHAMRKALPGYAPHLAASAPKLEKEKLLPKLLDFGPADLMAVHDEQTRMSELESVTKAVYDAAYYQRLQLDDQGMGMLQKIVRKIDALSDDDPRILERWKSLLDFFHKFRPGRPGAEEPASPPPTTDEEPTEAPPQQEPPKKKK